MIFLFGCDFDTTHHSADRENHFYPEQVGQSLGTDFSVYIEDEIASVVRALK